MSNIYSLKIVKNGVTIQRKQIATGLGKGVIPLTLKADADLTYMLQDESGAKPLAKIKTHFVGSDLHVVIDGSDEKNTHLILQNYADVQTSSALATTGKAGALVVFKTDTAAALSASDDGLITWVAPGIDDGGMWSLSSPVVWVGGALLVGAVASGSSSSSASSASTTALSKINTYINASSTAVVSTPVLKDYTDAGITGVLDNTMAAAMNTVLKPLGTATVASAQLVVDAYLKVWNKANGAAADTTTDDPTSADYAQLGLTPLPTGNGMLLLNDIVKTHLTTDVNTIAKLNALAVIANNIILAAADNTVTLAAADFNSIGLTDITTVNASAFLSAIVAGANDGSGVNSVANLKVISAAYAKVFAEADGVKANTAETSKLNVADVRALGALSAYDGLTGATGGSATAKALGTGVQQAAALKLLNDVIDGRSSTQVDTVAKLNQLNIVVDKVMDVSSAVTPAAALTVADFGAIGVTGVTSGNLAKVVASIAATHADATHGADGTLVDTLPELQAFASLAVVQSYSADSSLPLPTAQNFTDLGFTDITTVSSNLATALNSVVSAQHNGSISLAAVHTLALDFQSILNEATSGVTNNNPNPTALQYEDVLLSTRHVFHGGDAGSGLAYNALALLNDVVGHKSVSGVNTLGQVDVLATVVDHIINTAAGAAGNNVTLSELITTLGLSSNNFTDYSNAAKTTAVNNAIRATDDTGLGVHTWDQLQSILNAVILA